MRARKTFATCLRALSVARALAVVAMLLQAILYAEHLGASAVAGTAPAGARLGFLQICTGEGVVWMPVGDGVDAERVPQTSTHSTCPICTSPGVCGFDVPLASAVAAIRPVVFTPAARHTEQRAPVILWLAGLGQIRAPPAAFLTDRAVRA